ncbi:hypothetical protein KVR01_013644 [Diaporthe batatas]|uniref:uncharacterized protein n=1 Tax=Diaporthe batatas TaxID=748121 RepID=UPI001D049ED0|nr:uncharacterized protein KVR01_013644 [Diaporthe batatas]KAG8156540.1 hypothetical protein KVR01_013644 [Diaporthe batatas]
MAPISGEAACVLLDAQNAKPLWDASAWDDAFDLEQPDQDVGAAVVTSVSKPWLYCFHPSSNTSTKPRSVLILGGGGYVQLMVGREGLAVAQWLASLGFYAFVLVHRFPNAETLPQAPVDDARRALVMMREWSKELIGQDWSSVGVCGLSSGGHLAASLLAEYPQSWTPKSTEVPPRLDFAIIGYGPISTNAKGRTIIADKAPLEPPEKQELYDLVQPDVQLKAGAPPTFIVYSGNDPVVPVTNAYRLAEGLNQAGGQVELHIFADAPHGFALDTKDMPVSKWPELCAAWIKQTL